MCNALGYHNQPNILIFSNNGKFFSSPEEFKTHISNRFGVVLLQNQFDNETLRNRANYNANKNKDEIEKRDGKPSLKETISKQV